MARTLINMSTKKYNLGEKAEITFNRLIAQWGKRRNTQRQSGGSKSCGMAPITSMGLHSVHPHPKRKMSSTLGTDMSLASVIPIPRLRRCYDSCVEECASSYIAQTVTCWFLSPCPFQLACASEPTASGLCSPLSQEDLLVANAVAVTFCYSRYFISSSLLYLVASFHENCRNVTTWRTPQCCQIGLKWTSGLKSYCKVMGTQKCPYP